MQTTTIEFPQIHAFPVDWSWGRVAVIAKEELNYSHIHDVCELYVNISGDVSFMVGNDIYPVTSGDIIAIKPLEPHHCIYHSDCEHEHFCIWIPVNNNRELLSCFWDRPEPGRHLVSLPAEKRAEFVDLCYRMKKIRDLEGSSLEKYSIILKILSLINETGSEKPRQLTIPETLKGVLDYIDLHFASVNKIKDIAEVFFVSQNTLDRLFREHLHITPRAYIESKRLSHAKTLLKEKKRTVYECCIESGFSDYSHFIAKFKKYFGETPLQYKNSRK